MQVKQSPIIIRKKSPLQRVLLSNTFFYLAIELEAEDSVFLNEDGDTRTPIKTPKPSVSWLRRTEYISGEYSKIITGKGNIESRMNLNIETSVNPYKTREDHIRAIEESFEAVKDLSRHPTKPHLTAIDIIPVLPDIDLWMNQYTLCTFDDDPTMAKEGLIQASVNQALMKPMKNPDDPNDRFVLYFVPTESTVEKKSTNKRRLKEEEEPDVYECVKEYTMELKMEQMGQQYFFLQRANGIYYNELNSKLLLHQRRTKGKGIKEVSYEGPPLLHVTQREPLPEEIDMQQERLRELS
jgi:hypothetical protein